MPWGYHSVIEVADCDRDRISNGLVLTHWVKDLVRVIDMVAYGEPTVEHFAKHDPAKAGYTVVQLIETSSITGHFVDSTGDAYIDVFSCKSYDPVVVMDQIAKWLDPREIHSLQLARDVNLDEGGIHMPSLRKIYK